MLWRLCQAAYRLMCVFFSKKKCQEDSFALIAMGGILKGLLATAVTSFCKGKDGERYRLMICKMFNRLSRDENLTLRMADGTTNVKILSSDKVCHKGPSYKLKRGLLPEDSLASLRQRISYD